MSKYKSVKVMTHSGEVFDSRKEAQRFLVLKAMEKAGEIRDLKRQVRFELIPTQREVSGSIYKRGPRKGQLKPGKVIEQPAYYSADFTYIDCKTGELIVEDCKSDATKTKDYVLRRKLMLYFHGIRIKET